MSNFTVKKILVALKAPIVSTPIVDGKHSNARIKVALKARGMLVLKTNRIAAALQSTVHRNVNCHC